MNKSSLLCLILLPLSLSAAIESGEKVNVFEMKRRLQDQNRLIQTMTKEVSNVEMNLGIQNKKYLKLADERAKIEEMLSQAKKECRSR